MLVHEFIAVPRAEIIQNLEETKRKCGMEIISMKLKDSKKCIFVDDDFILDNYEAFLSGLKSHWYNINNNDQGLNYHGITILLNNELEDFINVLKKLKNKQYINELLKLCEMAMKQELDLIHFGI